jgi:hypothetical protein
LTYFDVPIIVFSSVNSVLIAGGRNFIDGDIIEITTCMLALATGIIQALRTFFKVDENRENCLTTYKDLFRLFCEVSIVLDQPRSTRGVDPQKFMADKTSEYKEIMSKAIVLEYKKALRDPIYHDRHPWTKADDMLPEAATPSSRAGSEGEARTVLKNRDVGLPLSAGDSMEELEASRLKLEEPDDDDSDTPNDEIPLRGDATRLTET